MGKIALLSQGAKLNIPNLIYWEMLLCFLYIAACKEQFKEPLIKLPVGEGNVVE